VRPERRDGYLWATVRTAVARQVLVRDYGFQDAPEEAPKAIGPGLARVTRPAEPRPEHVPGPARVVLPPDPKPEPKPQPVVLATGDTMESDPGALIAWEEFRALMADRAEGAEVPGADMAAMWPSTLLAEGGERLALPSEVDGLLDAVPAGEAFGVCVVVAVTGWGDMERRAVERALDAASKLGRGSHVVLVQNDPAVHGETRAWSPGKLRSLLRRRYSGNLGYSAACNLGHSGARKGTEWFLYTQADVVWSDRALRRAMALALDAQGDGVSPLVGVSGGFVSWRVSEWHVTEWGRNIGHRTSEPRALDFLAGYWVLAAREAIPDGGWDEGFFLYWEDVDFGLRAWVEREARSVALPALAVDHARGSTIRRRAFAGSVREEIRASSSSRFGSRWRAATTP